MFKVCTKCKQKKPIESFYRHKSKKNGYQSWCKECSNTYHNEYCQKNRAQMNEYYRQYFQENKKQRRLTTRKSELKTKFDMTPKDYDKMLDEQKGCCAVCGRHQSEFKRSLDVHHNHETGKVCGLLCTRCNVLLGHIEKAEKTGLLNKINIFREKYR